ncbi:MAG: hypothetical protein PQJ61_12295 [Spirochaetales bacterium]|uniref:Restriction endonuclease type IV Mrr domain-containing protein n=1 Tax=Candidatus Thalassospirochaeta sargassi TaxID=3119039 RepID=A0AAJ1ML67_9SPIO|nr:hypothetical protein [Spirochaetales bacterium]
MKYRITPQLISLTYEAALQSFWRHNALKKYLRGCELPEKYLNSWDKEETKRAFLDRVFEELQNNDEGKAFVLKLALSLIEQKTFPDLRNWEDSDIKIQNAQRAVQDLRTYLKEQNQKIRSEEEKLSSKKRANEERQKLQRQVTDKNKLQERLNSLFTEIGTQSGGYKFQDWFYDLLDYCEIDNKRPYVIDGRQIDGSLTHEGTTYLVELKFTASQSSATDVDSIKAKVNKMADNTMAILLSMSGFSEVAKNDASGSKTTLLLMESAHVFLFLTGGMNFKDIISRIRRHASQTGESYLSVNDFGK